MGPPSRVRQGSTSRPRAASRIGMLAPCAFRVSPCSSSAGRGNSVGLAGLVRCSSRPASARLGLQHGGEAIRLQQHVDGHQQGDQADQQQRRHGGQRQPQPAGHGASGRGWFSHDPGWPAAGRRHRPRRRIRAGRRCLRPDRRSGSAEPNSRASANTTPPLAVPSSLVTTSPVTPTIWRNWRTWLTAFWPVVPSITISTSCGAVGVELLQHAGDLAQLVHQAALGVQAAGGVGDQHIGTARARRLQGIEDHAGRVGVLSLRDHRHLVALAPGLQLADGGGAEGVAGGQHHLVALVGIAPCQLADGGGLADAIDAHGENHERLACRRHPAAAGPARAMPPVARRNAVAQRRRIGELALVHALAQVLDQRGAGGRRPRRR